MSKFEQSELKVYVQLFITMLSEKQAAGINAHVDVTDWTKALGKIISLSQQLESGELMLTRGDDFSAMLDRKITRNIAHRLSDGKWVSPFPKEFKDTMKSGLALMHVGVDLAEGEDQTVKMTGVEFREMYECNFEPDGVFDKRKLRDAIVKAVNLSEPAATRVVAMNKGHNVKELVYMALQVRGAQLCSARDKDRDASSYADWRIGTVLNEVEQLMMGG